MIKVSIITFSFIILTGCGVYYGDVTINKNCIKLRDSIGNFKLGNNIDALKRLSDLCIRESQFRLEED